MATFCHTAHTLWLTFAIWCVLVPQLFCAFTSAKERRRVMGDLRHRILPPRVLSETPKEAGFCLWLLHPEPMSRPKARCEQTET